MPIVASSHTMSDNEDISDFDLIKLSDAESNSGNPADSKTDLDSSKPPAANNDECPTRDLFINDELVTESNKEEMLRSMFTLSSRISSDSVAEPYGDCIGAGYTAAVYPASTTTVIKASNEHMLGEKKETKETLWKESVNHAIIQRAFEDTPSALRGNIQIPRLLGWIQPNNPLWKQQRLDAILGGDGNYGILSERIDPVPQPVMDWCSTQLRERHDNRYETSDCDLDEVLECPDFKFIQLSLGNFAVFSSDRWSCLPNLNDLVVYVDELEYMQLPIEKYATIMAETLAVLHWRANVDGSGIKFIIGSTPRCTSQRPSVYEWREAGPDSPIFASSQPNLHPIDRSLAMFCISFEQCKTFRISGGLNPDTVQKLADAFLHNYSFPRPTNASLESHSCLWTTFKEAYLKRSKELTSRLVYYHGSEKSPIEFIKLVEAIHPHQEW